MKKENVKKMRLLNGKTEVGLFNNVLPIFQYYLDLEAKPTDLCLLTGGVKDKKGYTPYFCNACNRDAQSVITSTEYTDDKHYYAKKNVVTPAIRPVLDVIDVPDARAIYFGEYPQFVEKNVDICNELTKLRNSDATTTGKTYCFDGEHEISEYEYKGNKYVPVISSTDAELLSDGTTTISGELYWVKVSPVIWYVDKDAKVLLSVYALLSGVRFWIDNLEEVDYEKSNMSSFINNFLMRDITNCKDLRIDHNEKLTRLLNLTERDITKINISRVFKEYKRILSFSFVSSNGKETINLYAKQNKAISSLPETPLKDILYKLLLNNANGLFELLKSTTKKEVVYNYMINEISLLNDAVRTKSATIDLSVLTTFLAAISSRIDKIYQHNQDYFTDILCEKWYMVHDYLHEIFNILTLTDQNLITKKLQKFVIYENKFNDILIRLDVDLGLYTPYNIEQTLRSKK